MTTKGAFKNGLDGICIVTPAQGPIAFVPDGKHPPNYSVFIFAASKSNVAHHRADAVIDAKPCFVPGVETEEDGILRE